MCCIRVTLAGAWEHWLKWSLADLLCTYAECPCSKKHGSIHASKPGWGHRAQSRPPQGRTEDQ